VATTPTLANTLVIYQRREQERGAEIEMIRSALIEGEKSGEPKRFDATAFERKLRRAHG
jgi:antitoxin ParD1/3/4